MNFDFLFGGQAVKWIVGYVLGFGFISLEALGATQSLGIWKGTIGKQQVMVSLALVQDDREEYPYFRATYYYNRYRTEITLSESPELEAKRYKIPSSMYEHQKVSLVEQHKGDVGTDVITGRWKLDWTLSEMRNDKKGSLTGIWSNPQRTRHLPIQLNKVITETQEECDDLCHLKPYLDPLLQAEKEDIQQETYSTKIIETNKYLKHLKGDRFQQISISRGSFSDRGIYTVQLMEKGQAIEAINKRLMEEFKSDAQSLWQCSPINPDYGIGDTVDKADQREDYYRKNNPSSHSEFSVWVSIQSWKNHFITFRRSERNNCGSKEYHPTDWSEYATYETNTGNPIDIFDWFQDKRLDYKEENKQERKLFYWFPEKLRNILVNGLYGKGDYPNTAPISDSLDSKQKFVKYHAYPSESGSGITLGFDDGGHDRTRHFDYADLAPFLTGEGKAALESLTAKCGKR